MIEADKRKAIYELRKVGMKIREISRRLGIDHNTIRTGELYFGKSLCILYASISFHILAHFQFSRLSKNLE